MSRRFVLGVLLFAGLLAAPFHAAAQTVTQFAGTWKLNIAKSTYDPGPPPAIPPITVLDVFDGALRTRINGGEGGDRTMVLARFDGKEHVLEGAAPPTTRTYKYIDANAYEYVTKVNGQETTTTRIVLARDRKTLTITATGKNAQGRAVRNVQLFEKQ